MFQLSVGVRLIWSITVTVKNADGTTTDWVFTTGSATALLAAQLLAAEKLGEGTHRFRLEQGYEMGRPSDLWLEADVAGAKLAAVRVAGQAVQISSGVLEV